MRLNSIELVLFAKHFVTVRFSSPRRSETKKPGPRRVARDPTLLQRPSLIMHPTVPRTVWNIYMPSSNEREIQHLAVVYQVVFLETIIN